MGWSIVAIQRIELQSDRNAVQQRISDMGKNRKEEASDGLCRD